MKYRIWLWMFVLGCLAACSDDEAGFDAPIESWNTYSFRPIAGGAVMRYILPDNRDIYGVRVRYENAYGEELLKDGTYLMDSIVLNGFTEARTEVLARVSFFNRTMQETEPVDVTFSTENSATVALFDHLQVNPFWGGFNVTYSAPENVNGMLHIFYVGINPLTQEPDSILMESRAIAEGGDTLNFVMKQELDKIEVVVRTDDYKGYRVMQKVVTVPSLAMDTLTYEEDFDFSATMPFVEKPEYHLGLKYLFDGDKKGFGRRKDILTGNKYTKFSTFVAGPDALNERFIIDLREPKIPASVNLYAFLYLRADYPFSTDYHEPFLVNLWKDNYQAKLPCDGVLYGTNEDPRTVDLSRCAVLYKLEDGPSKQTIGDSWVRFSDYSHEGPRSFSFDFYEYGSSFVTKDESVMEAEPANVLNMLCNYTGEKYRYLIFVVEGTFYSNRWGEQYPDGFPGDNPGEYVTFNELEVCVKKEVE